MPCRVLPAEPPLSGVNPFQKIFENLSARIYMAIPGGTEVLIGTVVVLLPIVALVAGFLLKWVREGHEGTADDGEPGS